MENGFLAIDDECVSRVVPTLEANDGMRPLGKEIHDGAFPLIARLGAGYDDVALIGDQPLTKYSNPSPTITIPSPKLLSWLSSS